jgi:hypothetical protein
VGLVGMGLATYFSVHAVSKKNASKQYCSFDPNSCTQQGVDLRNQARASGDLATVSVSVGGAVLGLGLILLLTAPSSAPEAPPQHARLGFQVGPQGGGVVVHGGF